jgi:hypothetical protein
MFHQSVTGTSEIISNKSDCEIKFYGDYTEMDLTMPREEDCKNMIKGYAIVPTTCNDAFVGYNEGESGLTVTYSSRERDEKSNVPLIMPIFKVIGEYVTTDRYDTVYLTYKGYNEKYIIEEFKSEYIESIVIETKKDIDIRPFLEYIESLFAPADNAGEYADKNNILDIPYEFCYTMTKEME